MTRRTRTIRVDPLARVEGEGRLHIRVKDGRVEDVRLEIFEPPRFFEAFLRGRAFTEAPDVTARICGICPVAYQMSAVHAMEDALGVRVAGPLRDLRRLLYCGEWIESHLLHVVLLHAPDFLGLEDGVALSRMHPEAVRLGLGIRRVGNRILTLLGGRSVHPISVRVGGFHRVPTRADLAPLRGEIHAALDDAVRLIRWAAELPYPELACDAELVTLRHPDEYPMNEGRIVSSGGLDIAPAEFENHFEEHQVPHSTALYSVLRGRGSYLTGPLARYTLNSDRLSARARDAAAAAGLGSVCRNPFRSLLVRCVEVIEALEEARRIIDAYEPPDAPAVTVHPRAGTGQACTEAPRGLLWHRYRLEEDGTIAEARIVPPTSQNQSVIEADVRRVAETGLALPKEELSRRCEQAVRNHDPCISCATHFLKLQIETI